MTQAPDSQRHHLLLLVAVLLAGVPVLFGFVRAINTGDDFRYLWLAASAIVGSLAVMLPRTAHQGPRACLLRARRAPSAPEPAVPRRRLSSWGRLRVRELRSSRARSGSALG